MASAPDLVDGARAGMYRPEFSSGQLCVGFVSATQEEQMSEPRTLENRSAGNELTPGDRAALAALKADYAIGTDAITAGDFATGERLYRRSFTEAAEFGAGFDEASPLMQGADLDSWLNTVREAVAPLLSSHHLVGSTSYELADDGTVHITAIFQATTLSGSDMSLTTVLGTYHDQARRVDGAWRLTKSFAKYISIQSGVRDAP
jgi:SnoaL-like domain